MKTVLCGSTNLHSACPGTRCCVDDLSGVFKWQPNGNHWMTIFELFNGHCEAYELQLLFVLHIQMNAGQKRNPTIHVKLHLVCQMFAWMLNKQCTAFCLSGSYISYRAVSLFYNTQYFTAWDEISVLRNRIYSHYYIRESVIDCS